jgi:glutathione synthase/RimK-type ligase-like ATP-grasp enzyme
MASGESKKVIRKPVTVLLLAAGSPGDISLIRGLKESSRYDVTLHATDIDPMKGNLFLPEIDRAYIVPRYDAPRYQEVILGLVKRLRADVLISDLDEDLPHLSRLALKLEEFGCRTVLPDPQGLVDCLDKMVAYRKLRSRVPQPETIEGGDVDSIAHMVEKYGRVILKARNLRGGRGVDLIENFEELTFYARQHQKRGPFIVQQFIEGAEYNCSSLHDMEGRLVFAATRIKLEDRLNKANTIAARIVDEPAVQEVSLEAVEGLGLGRGFNNVEVILQDGQAYVVDINGGRWAGQDMNLLYSGANLGELYVDLALGESVKSIDVPLGATSLKIKVDVVVTQEQIDGVERVGITE